MDNDGWTPIHFNLYYSMQQLCYHDLQGLHKTCDDFPSILKQAFTKAGFTPCTIWCDGAGEYICKRTLQFLADNKISPQFSNQLEQFGNGMSEKFVDTLGKGIRTLLLQSGCFPEFWGAAAHYYTDVYNHTPHSSVDNQIQYNMHHSSRCDVSWFRQFGCHATLFSCKDIVEHHKLAPGCEQGAMISLGMAH
eukprot:3614162-Rhodomonas_salina.1